ncbi:hypothetical protein RE428_03230 [Marinobacter nanhaiticus D15-8W]|uniref:Bifunctional metallophosphatase/5'-nucleotidase n=1 Tax=Marinobacter nanhaiticus D15-8W TaxID=626887 RepID=N6W4C2_9GAMM|nr:hypothetical protein [Marinobacter nanhaiticus]ENO14999.1 hypothetical protein J057_06601 [Marinobacter nanhaiticus D15-8W]BES69305.1 hypothetical protein RE428_03230 [Marinobacter nanhaiticus D15-8W]
MDVGKATVGLMGTMAAIVLLGCGDVSAEEAPAEDASYKLQLLHFSDIDGDPGVALDNVERFSALVNAFRARDLPTLLVSSGDNVKPGPLYYAGNAPELADVLGMPANGRAGIALMNALGVDASAIGNHDLDGGPAEFAAMLVPETDASGTYPGAEFPYLSANLDMSDEPALADLATGGAQPAAQIPGRIAPSTVIEVGGERIGLVGGTAPALPNITQTGRIRVSPEMTPDKTELYDQLAAVLQPAVDRLVDQGVNKIVLLAHMQEIVVEKALAQRLAGVDVIVAGGSSTLLADREDVLRDGHLAEDEYPLVYQSPAGEPVLVVNVDGDYLYLGRLVLTFSREGIIQLDKLDPFENGIYASIPAVVGRLGATPIPKVEQLAAAIRSVMVSPAHTASLP